MTTADTTIAAQILNSLEQRGVTTLFGLPGNHNLPFYRALESTSLTHYTARHEQGAAFMADGYARTSGKLGVCLLIGGPGLTNAATAIAQAYADSVPLLILTPVTSAHPSINGRLHELPDQQGLGASLCRASYTISEASHVVDVLAECFYRLDYERPGPIHIQVTLDALNLSVKPIELVTHTAELAPDTANRQAAIELINTAHAPVILAGGGAKDAGDALRRLAERWDAPVINTVNAKGVLSPAHPLAVGSSPSLPCINNAINGADVVLAVGTELGETDYDLLMATTLSLTGKLIRVDIDADQLYRNVHPAVTLQGDAEQVLTELHNTMKPQTRHENQSGQRRTGLLREAASAEPHHHLQMAQVLQTLDNTLPTAVVVGDSTLPTYYAAWMWEAKQPRSYFHSVSGFGTLGYAIPAAIGAKIAQPTRPVLAIVGDGGAQFTLAEFSVAVQYALPIIFLVWNNYGYSEIKQSMRAQGIATTSAEVTPPDYSALAKAVGCAYANPTDLAGLSESLRAAAISLGPSLIEVQQSQFIDDASGQWYA